MWADSEEFLHDNTTDDDNDDDGLNPFRHALQLLPLRSFPSNISGFLGRIMSDNSSTNTNSGGVVGGGNPVYRRIRQNAGLRESMHQSATTDHLRGDNSGNTALSLNALDRMEAGRSRGSAAGALMVRSNNYNLALSGDGEQQQSPQSELQPSLDSNGQPISSSHSPTSSSNVSGTLEEFMRLSSLLDSAVLDDDTRQVVQERRNHLNRILLRQHVERMAHSFRRDVGLSRDNNQRDQENRRPSDFDPNGAGNAATAAAGDGDDDSDDESGDPFDTNDRDRTSYGQADMRTSTGRRLMHILRERRRQAIRAQIASMR
jgi:hypothetical protein